MRSAAGPPIAKQKSLGESAVGDRGRPHSEVEFHAGGVERSHAAPTVATSSRLSLTVSELALVGSTRDRLDAGPITRHEFVEALLG
jgi:hypothetical protein